MSSSNSQKYWFPAKSYGWGWGIPSAWQGWVVLLGFIALALGGIPFVYSPYGQLTYLGYIAILTVGLVAICWFKGEPPHWRWGKDDA